MSREASRERYAAGTEFHVAKFERAANTGTYLDCPWRTEAYFEHPFLTGEAAE